MALDPQWPACRSDRGDAAATPMGFTCSQRLPRPCGVRVEPPLDLAERHEPPPPAPDDPELGRYVLVEEVDAHTERGGSLRFRHRQTLHRLSGPGLSSRVWRLNRAHTSESRDRLGAPSPTVVSGLERCPATAERSGAPRALPQSVLVRERAGRHDTDPANVVHAVVGRVRRAEDVGAGLESRERQVQVERIEVLHARPRSDGWL